MEEESILFVGEKNTENKKKGNIWRRKIYAFLGGEEKRGKVREGKGVKIFGKGR